MAKYIERSRSVEAVQFFLPGSDKKLPQCVFGHMHEDGKYGYYVKRNRDSLSVNPSDWIVYGNDILVLSNDLFNRRYEPVPTSTRITRKINKDFLISEGEFRREIDETGDTYWIFETCIEGSPIGVGHDPNKALSEFIQFLDEFQEVEDNGGTFSKSMDRLFE